MFASTVPPQVQDMIFLFIHDFYSFGFMGGLSDLNLLYLCFLKLYYIKG